MLIGVQVVLVCGIGDSSELLEQWVLIGVQVVLVCGTGDSSELLEQWMLMGVWGPRDSGISLLGLDG